MSHILVRWLSEEKWDVYPTRVLVDTELGLRLMAEPSAIKDLRGSVVLVRWSAEEPPAEAVLIEAGQHSSLEKKRTRLADQADTSSSQRTPMEVLQADNAALKKGNATLQEENAALRMENERLQHAVQELEAVIDATGMVKRLHRMLRAQEAEQVRQVDQAAVAAVVPAAMTDIGCGVLVESSTLQMLRNAAKSSGCKFARSLLKVLFPNDSWKEKSLHGRKSNAHRDIVAKEALDPTIVKALLGAADTPCALLQLSPHVKTHLGSDFAHWCRLQLNGWTIFNRPSHL
uniref:BEN domain-containing protein n=1 Tax=Ixodes ricinus TaxID=34613 RepID=V5H842_IXORI